MVRPFVTAFSPPINRVAPQVAVATPVASITWGRAPQISVLTVPTGPRPDTIGDFEFPIESPELLPTVFAGMTPDELAAYLDGNGLVLGDILDAVGETYGLNAALYKPDAAGFDDAYAEVSRQTSTVRVENPDDALQYVDVERIDVITFQGATGPLILKFSNPT